MSLVYTPLTPFDHIPPRNYVKFVLYLPLRQGKSARNCFDLLTQSLHRTLVQLPWLNGKVFPQDSGTPGYKKGQLEIRHDPVHLWGDPPSQLKFNELRSPPCDYEGLKEDGFPLNVFSDEELLPVPFIPDVDSGADVLVAQANFIPGGCILAASIFHPVCDGTGIVTILKVWAQNCRTLQDAVVAGADKPEVLSPESSDRKLLERLWAAESSGTPVKDIDPSTWKLLGLDPPDQRSESDGPDNTTPAKTNLCGPPGNETTASPRIMQSALFYISPQSFAALKNDMVRESKDDEPEYQSISSNDALCALIFRNLMKARVSLNSSFRNTSDENLEGRLEMTVDGRPEFSSNLPASYVGNVILINQSSMPLSQLVSPSTSLSSVALKIREGANAVQPSMVRDAFTLIRSIPDYGDLKLRFTSLEGTTMMITSLLMIPIHELRFGDIFFEHDGKPDSFRPLMDAFNTHFRICFILPRQGHGGVEVVVSLFKEEMEELLADKEFTKYAMFFCN